jgi:hypothetical protein
MTWCDELRSSRLDSSARRMLFGHRYNHSEKRYMSQRMRMSIHRQAPKRRILGGSSFHFLGPAQMATFLKSLGSCQNTRSWHVVGARIQPTGPGPTRPPTPLMLIAELRFAGIGTINHLFGCRVHRKRNLLCQLPQFSRRLKFSCRLKVDGLSPNWSFSGRAPAFKSGTEGGWPSGVSTAGGHGRRRFYAIPAQIFGRSWLRGSRLGARDKSRTS